MITPYPWEHPSLRGTYTVDYGGIVASSVMIIIPELVFYGLFQKKIVGGMVAGAVKG